MSRSETPPAAATTPPVRAPGRWGPLVRRLILFVACVLIVDAIAGERGVLELLSARRQRVDLVESIDRLREENVRLRDHARRLREDPRELEALARQELGFIRPGEILFIVKDTTQ